MKKLYVKKKFKVKVMFITSTKVICEVVDGIKDKYLNTADDKSEIIENCEEF